jgi:hypothetical protein
MKKIQLANSTKKALVDDKDFEYLNQFVWRFDGRYAYRDFHSNGHSHHIYMHQEIMHAPEGMEVDHKHTGNTLDNRRENLRVGTHSQNMSNAKKPITNTSGFKGVSWDKWHKKWHAQIRVNHRTIHLGFYNHPLDAANAYDSAAIKYKGEFARVNSLIEKSSLI